MSEHLDHTPGTFSDVDLPAKPEQLVSDAAHALGEAFDEGMEADEIERKINQEIGDMPGEMSEYEFVLTLRRQEAASRGMERKTREHAVRETARKLTELGIPFEEERLRRDASRRIKR